MRTLTFALLLSSALGFAPPLAALRRARAPAARMADADPTANPFVRAINVLQETLQRSPIATFKKELAKLQAGDYDARATKAELDALIADNAVVVFSFTTCPFCIKAKQLLNAQGARYTAVELDVLPAGYALRAEIAEMTGRTSVPAIFIGGTFVGGCNDGGLGGVMTLNNQNRLRPMLEAARALSS
jgi:glutaredoxin 3